MRANDLTSRNVNLHAVAGWESRGRPYTFRPVGVMVHHTAGRDSLQLCIDGRAGIPGPLCQFLIHKSGTVYLIAAGYANHAGSGSKTVLEETRRGIAPSADAAVRKLRNNVTGNAYYWGIEVENLGNGHDPYPLEQLESLVQLCTALCDLYGYDPNSIVHHREWTSRKIDMSWRGELRGVVADRLKRTTTRRKYKMLVYGRRGTPDYGVGSAGCDAGNYGVATSNVDEARGAVARNEPVIAIGKAAIEDLGFKSKLGSVVTEGNKTSVFGRDGLQSLGLLEQAIREVKK